MRTVRKRRYEAPVFRQAPDLSTIAGEEIKRCGVCLDLWPARDFTIEDGQERCPNCVDERTATWKAETQQREQSYAASRTLRPQVSQMPLTETFVGTVTSLEDVNAVRVTQSAPLRMRRGVASTLVLKGRSFSSADTISYSSGISDNSAPTRTPTQTTLSLLAAIGTTPGDNYNVTINDVTFRNILSVR